MDLNVEPYIEGVIGPHEVGVVFAVFLFGLVTIQAFTYFGKYPEDPRGLKTLVTLIWILLFTHTIISTFSLYHRTVENFGKLTDLDQWPAGLCGAFSISGLISSIVQSFFAYRLLKLSGRSEVTYICWTLSLARLGSILWISVTACETPSVFEYVQRWKWLVIFALSVSALIDFLIAGSLSLCLWSRRRDVFTHAQRVVDKLITWTIQTGVLTSLSSMLVLTLYATIKNFAWLAAYLVISGLFANYLLASLNARISLREDMNRKPTWFDIQTFPEPDVLAQPDLTHRTIAVRDDTCSSISDHVRPPGLESIPLRPNI